MDIDALLAAVLARAEVCWRTDPEATAEALSNRLVEFAGLVKQLDEAITGGKMPKAWAARIAASMEIGPPRPLSEWPERINPAVLLRAMLLSTVKLASRPVSGAALRVEITAMTGLSNDSAIALCSLLGLDSDARVVKQR